MSEPIVAADLFRAVMARAGGRCQCEGQCGHPHAKTDGRCPREHDHYASKHKAPVRLMAAPADPLTAELSAAALPAGELRAWCPGCYTAARRLARNTQATAAPAQDGLFDL
ncbi:hypothetical protein ACH4UT_27995 [Streptomyces sp. NPDC020799]|uniref:hypothetical protein n=1 Tax=Streptomyces sp. NPDC020799 TaxID=3365091 RepID=UPI0037A35AFB